MRKIVNVDGIDHIVNFITDGDGSMTAQCMKLPVITQGDNLEEAVKNIKEAIRLHLES